MKLNRLYKEGKLPLTKVDIIEAFRNLGITKGDKLMVHTSLSSFGYIVGGERDLIEAIQEIITHDGVLLMPGHSGWNTDPVTWSNPPMPKDWQVHIADSIRPFDKEKTPIDFMGRVPVAFSKYPGVERTNHPAVSFLVWGNMDGWLDQPLNDPLGKGSPLMKLYNEGGKVLMLGVDYSSVTALHLAEYLSETLPIEINKSKIIEDGIEKWVSYREKVAQCDFYNLIGQDFERVHQISTNLIGYSRCKLLNMKKLVDTGVNFFVKNELVSKTLKIDEITPLQHYLIKERCDLILEDIERDYVAILVIEYQDRYYSIDGNHELYRHKLNNKKKIDVFVYNEKNDILLELYKTLAEESLMLGIKCISDLADKVVSEEMFNELWFEKCQRYINHISKGVEKDELIKTFVENL